MANGNCSACAMKLASLFRTFEGQVFLVVGRSGGAWLIEAYRYTLKAPDARIAPAPLPRRPGGIDPLMRNEEYPSSAASSAPTMRLPVSSRPSSTTSSGTTQDARCGQGDDQRRVSSVAGDSLTDAVTRRFESGRPGSSAVSQARSAFEPASPAP